MKQIAARQNLIVLFIRKTRSVIFRQMKLEQ